ncbi:hypothetical protein GCM10022415_15840 [Knoellia locipacati]|uniref:Uncharacterized protein n=1 Tax=Knoellia locipacati TaxID=882824 RepID=A0A512T042_9MICO|nr:hypothetical protein KLO01_15810 [Knoellia locipacati]
MAFSALPTRGIRNPLVRSLNLNRTLALAVFRIAEGGADPEVTWRQEAEDPKGAFQALGTYIAIGAMVAAPLVPWPYYLLIRDLLPRGLTTDLLDVMCIVLIPLSGLIGYVDCRLAASREAENLTLSKTPPAPPARLDLLGNGRVLGRSSTLGFVASLVASALFAI